MTHARIPDFSQPVPVRSTAAPSTARRQPPRRSPLSQPARRDPAWRYRALAGRHPRSPRHRAQPVPRASSTSPASCWRPSPSSAAAWKRASQSQRALHDPAVAAEVLTAFDAASRDPRCDAAGAALAPAATMIVALVGMQLVRSTPRAATPAGAQPRHRVEGSSQHTAVVAVGPGEGQAERRAPGVHDEVALRARLAPVRRVRTRRGAPFFAGRLALSRAARDQSSASAS